MKHFTLVLAALTTTAAAQITCIDDPGLMAPDSVCINFENEVIGALANPYVVPGVTFSSPIGMGINDVSQWAADGTAVSNFTLHNASSHVMSMPFVDITIVFDEPVDMFVLGWFDANYSGNEVRVYDAAGLLLGTCEPQLGLPGGCCAAYVGAQSTSFNIKSVVVHPATHDDWYSIDNLYFHNDTVGSGYCFPTNNSTGSPAFIAAAGSDIVAQDNFRLQASSLPSGEFGYFLAGQGQ
ncbi:MAG: hypothetical protein P1V35_02435, partial [Planctomycetota bacterium]|nr:hypothetical protein [Planctomycetota bacterium]